MPSEKDVQEALFTFSKKAFPKGPPRGPLRMQLEPALLGRLNSAWPLDVDEVKSMTPAMRILFAELIVRHVGDFTLRNALGKLITPPSDILDGTKADTLGIPLLRYLASRWPAAETLPH